MEGFFHDVIGHLDTGPANRKDQSEQAEEVGERERDGVIGRRLATRRTWKPFVLIKV
jgi:hypothetical protein